MRGENKFLRIIQVNVLLFSFFRPIGLQFGLKIRGGGGGGGEEGRSLAPPLDPPLGFSFKIDFYFFWSRSGQFRSVSEILFFVFTV